MKLSIILSNVGACTDRYMTGTYSKEYSLDQMFERVASIDGVSGVELVGGWHITPDNVNYIKDKLCEYRLTPVSIIPDHFGTPIWGKGAFTAPDAKVRKAAIKETINMIKAAREIGCTTISIWNGQDGYDYPMQANYIDAGKWLVEGIAECAEFAKDMRISLEYKPKEPRNHCFMANVWSSILFAQETHKNNVGVTIDVGHAFMAYENVSDAICAAAIRGKLFHMHINDNYTHWDDDMMVGSIHTIEYIEMFYWLKKLDYKNFISVDQYPYREESRDAAEQSIKWMFALKKAADKIDDKKMQEILSRNDAVASTNYMREIIFG